jgi:SAM-dependent methyltransferase
MPSRIKNQPVAQKAYDALAEAYAQRVDTKPHNAYYERPATLSLLPGVAGLRVLDAGCGPGVYSEWLVEHGAQVVACDANRKMVHLARQRLGDKVIVLHANLEEPLQFAADASFDLIVSPLVMDYLEDWTAVFKEFHRILVAGGVLVFSMEHPFSKYLDHKEESNYFDTDLVTYTYRGFGSPVDVPSYRRPLGAVINPLIAAGFTLDCILEPQPTQEFKLADPLDYEELMHNPGFLCVRALRC